MEDAKQTMIDATFEILKEIFRPNMSVEEVVEKYSPSLDEIILKYEKEGVKFSAGKFKITPLENDTFALGYEIYFKDGDGKWSKVANVSQPMDAKIWLSKEAWAEIQSAGEKVFDVAAPEENK